MTPDRLLIIGTLGGGGIHQYIEQQYRHLDSVEASVYDMVSDPKGEGKWWLFTSVVASVWAAVRFPFRTPPDAVHVHTSHRFSFYRSAFYVLYASIVWDRPVVLHVHGSSFDSFVTTDSWLVNRIQTLVFGKCDRIIVLSPYWEEVLSTRVPAEKIRVLPNAIAPSEYSPDFETDTQHVVFVSNLVERKGVYELTGAIEDFLERDTKQNGTDIRFSIAGSGPLKDRVESLADQHDAVEYLGYVSERKKRTLLDSGTIFVLPAYAEGLPIALLEGMAGGNAVISTTVGSIPEVIDEENGLLIEPKNTTQLSDALATLVADPERTEAMGRTNRQLVTETYSWDTTQQTLREIYAELPA
ncbi:glycosyltransferase family 4 protein [Halocatena pleomorpha]|uniref:Glycosyltransferase family 1 protein n=1 Tax=Halocatena pleomorpha TaxID=1785090 RepID=A0A3P3RLA1_9EURY|nr:glycosyltransferase family 4 protein [Halocatena pleomorpha]RRJ33650.1 glycosyltransferase family 1 protein [Halocatena pleomorpha]